MKGVICLKLRVNGYSCVTSKKDGKQYTIVHGTSDIGFSNGAGSQNYNVFLSGHVKLNVGQTYDCITDTFMQGDELKVRVTGLK